MVLVQPEVGVDASSVGQLAPGHAKLNTSGGLAPGPGVITLASATPFKARVESVARKMLAVEKRNRSDMFMIARHLPHQPDQRSTIKIIRSTILWIYRTGSIWFHFPIHDVNWSARLMLVALRRQSRMVHPGKAERS